MTGGNRFRRRAGVSLLSLALGACSTITGWFDSDDDEAKEPAPLVEFVKEMDIDTLWSASVGNGQGKLYNFLTPVIDQSVIYAAGSDGTVLALNRDNGRKIWKTDLDTPLSGGVGYGAGQVLVGNSDGQVMLLDADNGDELWRVALSGEVLSPPQTNGDVVIAQTYDGRLHGLDADDGGALWEYDSDVPVLTLRGTSTPVISDRLAIAGFASGKVIAFDIKTGATRWEARVDIAQGRSEIDRIVDVDGEMLLINNVLYAVSYQGRLIAIEVAAGRKIWQQEASSSVGLDQGFGNIYVSEDSGSVVAFYRSGQGVRWEQPRLENRRLSAPTAVRGFVAVGDFEGYLHFLSQVDGRFVGRIKIDGEGVRASMLAQDDVLYVYGNSGKLVALRVSAGDT